LHDLSTSDLVPLLAERGIHLSRAPVYRLVTSTPQHRRAAALCDILDCTPNDLITVAVVNQQVTKPARSAGCQAPGGTVPARRTTIRRPDTTT
jgi:hypothetical protein